MPDRRTARFLALLLVAGGALVAVDRADVLEHLLAPVTGLTASATLASLQALGFDVQRHGTVIRELGGFSYDIGYRCTGVLPVAILAAAIVAWPARPRPKLYGVAIGLASLLALNLARLVHLFAVGSATPQQFGLWHDLIWQGLMVLAVLALWFGWLGRFAGTAAAEFGPRPAAAAPPAR